MLRYLLDTNICIYTRDNRPPTVAEPLRRIAPGDLAMSAITYGE